MSLSSATFGKLVAQETGEAGIVLLTLSHPSLSPPLRVTSDAVATVSRGHTYIPYPFELTPPRQGGDEPEQATLTIDNVDRQIALAVRSIVGDPIQVRAELVLAGSPDSVEVTWFDLPLLEVRINALTVSGRLGDDDPAREPFPAGRMTPATVPGIF